jgi:flagellar biogenesis protein FliO
MNIPFILLVVVFTIYLVWKLMSTGKNKKPVERRFSIRKHRKKETEDED